MSWSWGTVTRLDPVGVRLDGDSIALPLKPVLLIAEASLELGDRVWCQLENRRLIVHSRDGGLQAPAEGLVSTTVLGAMPAGNYASDTQIVHGRPIIGQNYMAFCFNGDWNASGVQVEPIQALSTCTNTTIIGVNYRLVTSPPGAWRLTCFLIPVA